MQAGPKKVFQPDPNPKNSPKGPKNSPKGPKKVQKRPKMWPNLKQNDMALLAKTNIDSLH